MMGLTRRQADALAVIRARQERDGVSPSYAEIGSLIGCNKSTVHRLIDGLENRGHIRRLPNAKRAVEIVPGGSLAALRDAWSAASPADHAAFLAEVAQ